jgi:hypothetical protein
MSSNRPVPCCNCCGAIPKPLSLRCRKQRCAIVTTHHHSLDQQLCRWLLLRLDRLPGDELLMTQELIANMLGVRREGVTEAAMKLRNAGLIRYARGRISVLDRTGIERPTCECYAVVKKVYDRLLPEKRAG